MPFKGLEKGTGNSRYSSLTDLSDEERIRLVRRIFSSVTDRYDFLNRLLSGRRDVAWRRFMIRRLHFFSSGRLLDLATGTGDVAIGAAGYHPQARIFGLDFARPMLEAAREKVGRTGLMNRISLMQGDAMHLPFPDHCFDAITVAFGIRNMPDRKRVWEEMMRVLVPGGRISILELTAPQSRWFRRVYLPYLNHILPRLSRWFTKDPAAYQYLAESILHFPPPRSWPGKWKRGDWWRLNDFPFPWGLHISMKGESPNPMAFNDHCTKLWVHSLSFQVPTPLPARRASRPEDRHLHPGGLCALSNFRSQEVKKNGQGSRNRLPGGGHHYRYPRNMSCRSSGGGKF